MNLDLTAEEYASLRAAYLALMTTDTPQQVTLGGKSILYYPKNLNKMKELLNSYNASNTTGGTTNLVRFDNAR